MHESRGFGYHDRAMISHARTIGLLLTLGILAAGCATQRVVKISASPPDATIKVDGVERGRAPVTEKFVFNNEKETHRVTASRLGFKDQTVQVARDFTQSELLIELRPQTRRVYFSVVPVPGVVLVNGEPLAPEPVGATSVELEFTVDAQNNWNSHTITAERPGWRPASQVVSWTDLDQNYVLKMEPMRKDLSITTDPPGAQVFVDGQLIGTSPVTDPDRDFPVEYDSNQFIGRKIRAEKPGYDPVEMIAGWDEGKNDYHIDIPPKSKRVRVFSEPDGADVAIEGVEGKTQGGMTVFELTFPPVNEKGELRTYTARLTKKTADSEWYPAELEIGWDGGRTDYRVELREILTRPVPLTVATFKRADAGWEVVPVEQTTIGFKDLTEGPSRRPPVQIVRLAPGESIGSMALSPDGTRIVYTVLVGRDKAELRSVMRVIRTDGSGSTGKITDGRTLDLTPSYSPSGDQILFSSNRAGRRLNIWSMPADGAGGITRLTASPDSSDLWPSLDSDPKPRLFYQAMIDTRSDPRLYMTPINTVHQMDLTQLGGEQPRVSPKNDSVLFAAANESTGKRDIYRVSDKGGAPENLTNTPEFDEFDAAWTRDGRRFAFACDRGQDSDGRHNFDIWIMDLTKPGEPQQVTVNGSVDDQPLWDPAGDGIYFRSNRGGTWGIWRANLR